ncbi:MAG TPA: phospho-N-acetylmuramoyl-pentapeptide-transferase [Pirellulales bacterium]
MLVWLLNWLEGLAPSDLAGGDVGPWGKITFRAALAAGISFFAALALGSQMIGWLNRRFREPIVSASPELRELHQHKQSTPTMGGLFLVVGLLGATLLMGDWGNHYLPIVLVTLMGLAAVGASDDLIKLSGRGDGLRPRAKLIGQTIVALVAALLLYGVQRDQPGGLDFVVPLVGRIGELGWLFIPLAILVVVGSSNAVNLTDGLDGLAGGCLLSATCALALIAYASGHAQWAAYLNVPHLAGAGELVVVAGGLVGGILGFLWFNCHPAQVFMGNTGSLALCGVLGLMAVIVRQELLLAMIGGVFVVETMSVVVQVAFHRWTGRRVFRCAPLHHHFQLLGWPESKIVVRFWIASVLCAVLGLAALKASSADRNPTAANRMAARELPLAR